MTEKETTRQAAERYFDEWVSAPEVGYGHTDAIEYAIARYKEENGLAAKLERLVMWVKEEHDGAVHIEDTGSQAGFQVMDIYGDDQYWVHFGTLGKTLEQAVDAALKEIGEAE